ncbi:Aste57867_19918 [Aphanomyces stellatus]|uniref:Aste57867_19918 protein n=1 Tax=Aphanomyces stellatus TaxID=120398 RepID=A0A485LDM3_9STRA|nr:hypothetical protein As57867_019852 [Aphanomyces stellatus]VFT96616.1 Aste57867_19918 [Aphanomyces stellatus]
MPRVRSEAQTERRRIRSRISQRLYRVRTNASHRQLEDDVATLAAATARLEGHKDVLERGLWCHAEELSVLEYVRLMTNGYAGTPTQDAFFRRFVSDDVAFMGHTGVAAVRAMWDSYNTFFASVRLDCQHLVSVFASAEFVIVEAVVVGSLEISDETIRCLFPQVLLRHDLRAKMFGRDLKLPVRVLFTIDATSKHFVQIESEANVVGALLDQFGNLDDVVGVAGTSGIQPNAMLVSQVDDSVQGTTRRDSVASLVVDA